MSTAIVIGSGFSALSAACYLSKNGVQVTVMEKNDTLGGRARMFEANGFKFDMGPSWYWMPDIFESFFNDFGKSASDYYDLIKLDPGFQLFFGGGERLQVPSSLTELFLLFESIEKGSSEKLKTFLKEGELKYTIGMKDFAYKPALSWFEFANRKVLHSVFKTHLFNSIYSYVRKHFNDKRLITLMEFPVLFLGAKPDKIPALYSMMNYSALVQGTYYPMGGMFKIIEGMKKLADELGVTFIPNCNIVSIESKNNKVTGVISSDGVYTKADVVISSADYNHTEQKLLKSRDRNYNDNYWENKVLAPSCLIFYLGVNKKIQKLQHHNIFSDRDFETHANEIYDNPKWPGEPLFYVCCPSKTDNQVAPEGMENLFILIPIAPGLKDTEEIRAHYFQKIMKRLEYECDELIENHIVYNKSYCINDFVADYNAYKGNAYGLANTLRQTAVFKPSAINKHLKNLFYTGQLTVPGPGVPPALISGKISSQLAFNYIKNYNYETII